MRSWVVKVGPGQTLNVDIPKDFVLHMSQANVGEVKDDIPTSVVVYVASGNSDEKYVLATLHTKNLPQCLCDIIFEDKIKLSHNWEGGDVYFYGYQSEQPLLEDDPVPSEAFAKFIEEKMKSSAPPQGSAPGSTAAAGSSGIHKKIEQFSEAGNFAHQVKGNDAAVSVSAYPCDKCPKICITSQGLESHKRAKHSN